MIAGLQALLTGVVDYAGLFPPARLRLDEALSNYARYRLAPTSWMLGHFVIAGRDLPLLTPPATDYFEPANPLKLAVIGRGGADHAAWFEGLEEDLTRIYELQAALPELVVVAALEIKLPADVVAEAGRTLALEGLLDEARARIAAAGLPAFDLFLEAPGERWEQVAAPLVEWQARQLAELSFWLGLKLRTGGLAPHDAPPVDAVAQAICAARDYALRWKATAGLHHALYQPDDDGPAHGFLNVLLAAALAHAAHFTPDQITAILVDQEASDFRFFQHGVSWRQYDVTLDQIEIMRRASFSSFGSCSFDDPRTELERLLGAGARG